MTHGFHRLLECKRHGFHATETCPLCETDPAPPAEVPKPETKSRWHNGKERELHDQFERWLRFHEIEFVHSRMDKPSTIEKGWPDFSCFRHHNGHDLACFVEFKTRQGRLRLDQEEVIARMARRGIDVLVTGDFTEACDFVRARLALKDANAKDQAPAIGSAVTNLNQPLK